ncbi:MAG: OprO/OprP family phosphate-selective porin [Geobacteraceae bacterium]|nr:OprO/OprP family phosphate-selective porin [Geobacteraceae bacterium]
MKRKVATVICLSIAMAGQSTQARTLEDVLKEKGVITEEDYKEVTRSRPVDYRLGKGFTFTSPNEKFQLSLGARLQPRYTFTDNDTGQDSSEFRVRRMKLFLSGYAFTKDVSYKLQVNFAESNTASVLEDAWLNYRLLGHNEAQIFFGQDKVPFARQELTSSGAQQFVDRANVTDTFKAGRDTGLMLHGKIMAGLVNYNAGVFNGAGQTQLRSSSGATNHNAFAARVTFNPLGDMPYSEADLDHGEKPLVSVGADYYFNTLKKVSATAFETTNKLNYASNFLKPASFGASEKVDVDLYSIDLAFKWLGASAQAEYFIAQADGQVSNSTQRGHGFYAQAGYFIIPKQLELAGRYSYADVDRDVANDLRTEVSGAVSYYFNKHNLKVQGDVTDIHRQPAKSDDLQCRLQAQIIF